MKKVILQYCCHVTSISPVQSLERVTNKGWSRLQRRLFGIYAAQTIYTQTAHKLSQARLSRHILVPARHTTFPRKVFWLPSNGHNFHRNSLTFNIKLKIFEFSLFLIVLFLVSKGFLNIPEYRRLFICRVLQLFMVWHLSPPPKLFNFLTV